MICVSKNILVHKWEIGDVLRTEYCEKAVGFCHFSLKNSKHHLLQTFTVSPTVSHPLYFEQGPEEGSLRMSHTHLLTQTNPKNQHQVIFGKHWLPKVMSWLYSVSLIKKESHCLKSYFKKLCDWNVWHVCVFMISLNRFEKITDDDAVVHSEVCVRVRFHSCDLSLVSFCHQYKLWVYASWTIWHESAFHNKSWLLSHTQGLPSSSSDTSPSSVASTSTSSSSFSGRHTESLLSKQK